MSLVILRGHEAVHYAHRHHLTVHCDADETHDEIAAMPLEEAEEVERDHPELLWVEADIHLNSGVG